MCRTSLSRKIPVFKMENKTSTDKPTSFLVLLGKGLFAVISSALIVYSIKASNQIYIPTFVAGLSGLLIGFIAPRKGWMLALLQNTVLIVMFWATAGSELTGSRLELELFSLVGSVLLTFIVSLGAAFIKRAD